MTRLAIYYLPLAIRHCIAVVAVLLLVGCSDSDEYRQNQRKRLCLVEVQNGKLLAQIHELQDRLDKVEAEVLGEGK